MIPKDADVRDLVVVLSIGRPRAGMSCVAVAGIGVVVMYSLPTTWPSSCMWIVPGTIHQED